MYLFLAVLGLRCCLGFLLMHRVGLLSIAGHGLLVAEASLVAEHGLQSAGLSSRGTRA